MTDFKRLMSLLLTLVLLAGMLPPTAVRAEEMETIPAETAASEETTVPVETTAEATAAAETVAVTEAATEPAENAETIPAASDEALDAAATGPCGDDLTWSLTDGLLTISGSGSMYDYAADAPGPWCAYEDAIDEYVIEEGVASIGAYAFCGLTLMEYLELPSSIASIGSHAFAGCTHLYTVDFLGDAPEIAADAFSGNETTGWYPDAYTGYASLSCTGIEFCPVSEKPGSGVVDDGANVIVGECGDGLEWSIDTKNYQLRIYPTGTGTGHMYDYSKDSPAPWREHVVYAAEIILDEGVGSIGAYGFYEMFNVREITIPSSIIGIGGYAFGECSLLKTVTFAGDAMAISSTAFSGLTLTAYYPEEYASWDSAYKQNYGGRITWKGYGVPEQTGTCGSKLTWAFDEGTETLTISGQGPMTDYTYTDTPPWDSIKFNIKHIVVEEGVTSIGDQSLGIQKVTSIRLPESLERIGKFAFSYCSIDSIELPHNLQEIGEGAFFHTGLNSIEIPHAIKRIEDDTFYQCTTLSDITLPEGITYIGSMSFRYSDLVRVDLPSTVTEISSYAFDGCYDLVRVSLPEGLTTIGSYAFSNCSRLTQITLPSTVTSIGTCLFASCEKLETAVLGGSYTELPRCMFQDCTALTSVTLPDTITRINGDTFLNCTSLEAITLPDSITTILGGSFENCTALKSIALPESLNHLDGFAGCSSLESVTFRGTNLQFITTSAFENCTALKSIVLPDSLTNLGSKAFQGCTSLESVTLSANQYNTGEYTFSGCTSLKEITITGKINAISAYSFSGCTALETVHVEGDRLAHIYKNAFEDCTSLKNFRFNGNLNRVMANAFSGCVSLETANFEDSNAVLYIEENAFANCTGLTTVVLRNNLQQICAGAFSGCTSLASVKFNNSFPPKGIAQDAFTGVTATVLYPQNDNDWPEAVRLDYGGDLTWVSYYKAASAGDCGANTWWHYADGVLTIYGSGDMYSWDDPETENALFAPWYCWREEITSVEMDNFITSIGSWAFAGCSKLASIAIPGSITAIGDHAFADCGALTEITFSGSAPTIGENTFAGVTAKAVYMPGDSWTEDVMVSYGGTITWEEYPLCIVILEHTRELLAGETVLIQAAFSPENLTGTEILWTVTEGSDAVELDILENAVRVTAKPVSQSRTVRITASAADGSAASATTELTVVPNAEAVVLFQDGAEVSGKALVFDVNASRTMELTASVLPEGAIQAVSWTSSAPKIAAVTDGTVEFTGAVGTVKITATTANKKSASVTFQTLAVPHNVGKPTEPAEGQPDLELLAGKSVTLTVIDKDTGKALTGKQITWSMEDCYAPYAKLDAKGKLTAQKVVAKQQVVVVGTMVGNASIQVTYVVDIYPAVTTVELLHNDAAVNNQTIFVDSTAEPVVLTANIHPLDAMAGVTWSIGDKKEAFASYEIAGNTLTVTPKADAKPGTVTVKVTSNDGSKKAATVKLQFAVYAMTVTIDESVTTLTAGDKAVQLNAAVEPAVVSKSGIVWSLKNPADKNYVNLSSGGKITPKAVLAPVDVTLVATSKDGMASDEHTIRILPKSQAQLVLKDEKGNYVTKTTQILDVNTQEAITLSAFTYGEETTTAVDWTPLSSKTAEITVNADGSLTIRMLAAGSLNITAKAEDGRKATVSVKGVKLAQGIEISQKKTNKAEGLEVASGKSVDLQVTLTDAASKKVTWSIEKGDAYGSITSSGKFTAAKDLTSAQEVIVRATTADGSEAYDEMPIMVRPIAQGVQVYTLEDGVQTFRIDSDASWWVRSNTTLTWDLSNQEDTIALGAHVYPYYGEDDAKNAMQTVSFKSSTPKVADFQTDEEGNVQLKIYKTGSVTITATAEDGSKQKVTFKLNVVRSVTELIIEDQAVPSGKSLNLAKFLTINPTDATNKKLTWEITGGNAYATVSGSGSFKAKKVTSEQIVEVTVRSQDGGASTTFYVTIIP